MPYDIYGQPLRRGHCEVHPDHPEEYPCSCCMEEYYLHEAEQAEADAYYEQLAREHDEHLVREFWSCHIDDEGRHPMEDVTGGD